ncbi:ABATE domain-containing protein [Allosalinactinospora lopnorensis]|uniref:ABATE domain-containing protein n=1 Tax=Allosalinactinospora lopnorensis TaxID=1352348 RepID=UPI000623C576|nr:ABATE domain-containing protein [Allosalinactinospora lopnorensis]
MTTPTEQNVAQSTAATLVGAFVATGDELSDRADLARFLRDHRLITDGAIPITLADFDEAIALRDGMHAQLLLCAGHPADHEAVVRGQRVLDGLRVTVRIEPGEGPVLAPAVVDEVRRGLARVAGAWATVLMTGEWRRIRIGE